jgi:hypothetical protein
MDSHGHQGNIRSRNWNIQHCEYRRYCLQITMGLVNGLIIFTIIIRTFWGHSWKSYILKNPYHVLFR